MKLRIFHVCALGFLCASGFRVVAAAVPPCCLEIQNEGQETSKDLIDRGVRAYRVGDFDEAIELFKKAKALNPDSILARLYLATSYATQYIPSVPSDENARLGQQAIDEYRELLERDPDNLSAIDGIASTLYNMGSAPFERKMFDESKFYHETHIRLKPKDPEPYYWIGVIDWVVAYRGNNELRAAYNAKLAQKLPDGEPMPPGARVEFAAKYGSIIDEGIEQLRKAIELRNDYDDAMAYLNLLYRQKADAVFFEAER